MERTGISRNSGLTLIELVVVVAVLSILAAVALPVAKATVKRTKEIELRRTLREVRTAIDEYKKLYDEKKISQVSGGTGYPKDLDTLVQGVDQFLPVDQAFRFDAGASGPDRLTLSWQVTDGYYLYKSRIKVQIDDKVANPPPVQIFYVPIDEDDALASLAQAGFQAEAGNSQGPLPGRGQLTMLPLRHQRQGIHAVQRFVRVLRQLDLSGPQPVRRQAAPRISWRPGRRS